VCLGSLLPIEVQEKMRNRKNDLSVMMRRITSARNTVNVLTEDDEEMALMNLTVLRNKPHLYQYVLPYCCVAAASNACESYSIYFLVCNLSLFSHRFYLFLLCVTLYLSHLFIAIFPQLSAGA
jgi:Na+/melibiose symporter-like transporter